MDMDQPPPVCGGLLFLALDAMGCQGLASLFTKNGIGLSQFLNLTKSQISKMFPTAEDQQDFVDKYLKYLADNALPPHESLKGLNSSRHNNTVSSGQGFESVTSPVAEASSEIVTLFERRFNRTVAEKENMEIESETDNEEEDPDFDPLAESSRSEEISAIVREAREVLGVQLAKSNVRAPLEVANRSSIVRPQVNRQACGSKRNIEEVANQETDDLDLLQLLKNHPYSKGVLDSYTVKPYLKDVDRSIILDVIVPWLLNITLYPTRRHFENLTNKIIAIFPSEKASKWYLAPYSEGDCKNSRGKLPDKVRNAKDRLRQQGSIPRVCRKKNATTSPSLDPATAEENVSIEWLKRNKEGPEEVMYHWKQTSKPRLLELLHDKAMAPAQYIKEWNDLLKLPIGYKLVQSDFEALPDVDQHHECIRGKGGNLLSKWSTFAAKIKELVATESVLSSKERAQFSELLESAATENDKDYVILHMLPMLCKQKGRIKMGNTTFKPSVKECSDAFVLRVPGAQEFDQTLRNRQDRYGKFGAPIQPYVLIQGEKPNAVRAPYVILEGVPWKLGSVLTSVDVCFKTCFALNCGYPPEAHHIWYFIQTYLYEVRCPGDRSIGSVTDFLQLLE